ncbi:amidase signature enzyme [Ramaria rubella]|nr:amidase signature enzyme [Ramaria rubella]
MTDNIWRSLCLDKKKRQEESIPKDWMVRLPSEEQLNVTDFPHESGLLTTSELEITETNVEVLLTKLASSTWSSVDVTRAFYKRAILAHQVVNCLTEIFVEQALNRAAVLHVHLKSTGQVIGPLHGSAIKGLENIVGKTAMWRTLVRVMGWEICGTRCDTGRNLIRARSSAFVRTNVPQTLMWAETFNHAFGRTLNPFNRSLSCVADLLVARVHSSASMDPLLELVQITPLLSTLVPIYFIVGGSIRIPSAFNELYGLRPSFNRIPFRGALNSLEGQDSLPPVIGPISYSISGLKIFMKAIIDAKPWRKDALMVHKPWDQQSYELVEHGNEKKLVFAIMWNDELVIPHPPIHRALEMTRDALVAAGYKGALHPVFIQVLLFNHPSVIDWKPFRHEELLSVARSICMAGGTEEFATIAALTGEPILSTMSLHQNNPPHPDFPPAPLTQAGSATTTLG